MPAYRYLIDQDALLVFELALPEEQAQLLQAFRRLAMQPEQECDLHQRNPRGPDLRGKWFGNWLLRYYVDSPVRHVVIVSCEWT